MSNQLRAFAGGVLLSLSVVIVNGCGDRSQTSPSVSPPPKSVAPIPAQSLGDYAGWKAALEKGAQEGQIGAQYALATEYLAEYEKQNLGKAVELLTKVAEKGGAGAQFLLAQLYLEGKGVPKSDDKAIELLRKSAEHGYPDAENALCDIYHKKEETAGAEKHCLQAIKLGFPEFRTRMNWIRIDRKKGLDRSEKFVAYVAAGNAQLKHYPKIVNGAGIVNYEYRFGIGNSDDNVQAADWFKKADVQGQKRAQEILGGMYMAGDGIPGDSVLAYAWLNVVASDPAQTSAGGTRDLIKLNDKELGEAQHLSAEWAKGKELARKAP